MLQWFCHTVLVITYAAAASTGGKKFCSGDLLQGFIENGEEGCCVAEGLCHDPELNIKWAQEINKLSPVNPITRKKRSLDLGGYIMRNYLVNSKQKTPQAHSSQLLVEMKEFQESAENGDHQTCPVGCSPDYVETCSSNVLLSFPLFGTSVIRKEKVHIIQALSWFDQPVVRRLCKHRYCSVVRGACRQVVQPHLMFVKSIGDAGFGFDYVYVEAGCECHVRMGGPKNTTTYKTHKTTKSAELVDLVSHTQKTTETTQKTIPSNGKPSNGNPSNGKQLDHFQEELNRTTDTESAEENEDLIGNVIEVEETTTTTTSRQEKLNKTEEPTETVYEHIENAQNEQLSQIKSSEESNEDEEDSLDDYKDNESPLATSEAELFSETEPDEETTQINGANSPKSWYSDLSTTYNPLV